jgi:hypothetical protein
MATRYCAYCGRPSDRGMIQKCRECSGMKMETATDTRMIQGYVPTLTNRGKLHFAKFGGGITREFDKAEVCQSIEEAFSIARSRAKSIYDVSGYLPIDEEGLPVED